MRPVELPRAPAPDVPSLQTLGRYRLLRLLGKGGMSEVYLGYDPRAGQPVAVKLMSERLAEDLQQLHRFERETLLTKRLEHPNIVRGFDSGRDPASKRRYLVLEYVDGPSALSLMERRKQVDVNDVVHIGLAIGRGLKHLHARNLIHRDIKPDNILLSPCGEAKLIDLGLVKIEEPDGEPLTLTSDGLGTSYYMPLEQGLNAHFVDPRSDLFALGATLYHLVTGRVPFPGNDHHEVMRMKDAGHYTPASLYNRRVPAVLEAILNRLLARDPRQRYRSAGDFLVDLDGAGLVTGLPSYADLGQALRDPPKMTAENKIDPTRPDLRLRVSQLKKSRSADLWIVRYQDRQGWWKIRKATTGQLLTALKANRFSGQVQGARRPRHKFRPLSDFPEFHAYFPRPDSSPSLARPNLYRRLLSCFGLRSK
jgi:serine/threonine-protein kinase